MVDNKVKNILHAALELDDDFVLENSTRLQDIPNLDSLGQVRLVMEIEQILGDRLTMDEIISIESVGNIQELLATRGK